MAVKRAIDRKMKISEENDKDRGIKLHRTNCDTLYRWSMWRMYLNDELSGAISARRDHLDHSNTVDNVTSAYIRHPDGKKYGHQMKKMFRNVGKSRSHDCLSDNAYLVYGLPRVSLQKRIPDEVRLLHESMHELEIQNKLDRESHSSKETDEQISKLFDFVTADEKENNSQMLSKRLTSDGRVSNNDQTVSVISMNDSDINSTKTKQNSDAKGEDSLSDLSKDETAKVAKRDIYQTTKSGKEVPHVSKSRLFWEKLAEKKSEIVDLGKVNTEPTENHEHTVISAEILQKQQKLLRKTIPKRTSKDLWRTLRERKTEILQMREMSSPSGKTFDHHHEKKHDSKTSQLWGFIFHKKKELVHMKRGRRQSHEITHGHHNDSKAANSIPKDDTSNISPRNFEDSFQKELAERLRKRRVNLEPASTHEILY